MNQISIVSRFRFLSAWCALYCICFIFCTAYGASEGAAEGPATPVKTFSIPSLPFELKPEETLSASLNWVSLDETSPVVAAREDKQIILKLTNNARFRSSDVAAYPPSPAAMTLTARWQITNATGAMGFGWIDFSTSQYYYLYEDLERQELILQRGDGVSTKQLALYSLPASAQPRTFSLTRSDLGKGRIQLSVLVDGTEMGAPVTDQPDKESGSTFQIYVGSGNNAEVSLQEISTIPAADRKQGSGWFW
jgi:hypothetical protein